LVDIVGLEVTTVFARVDASEIQLGAALRKVEAKLAGTCTVAIRGVEEGALVWQSVGDRRVSHPKDAVDSTIAKIPVTVVAGLK
jgi:hypothetical protein